jgi:SRSO17 transposase
MQKHGSHGRGGTRGQVAKSSTVLTHSKWDARAVIDHVARETDTLLGEAKNACLLIDESGFEKQGRMSVGTARQWLGRWGMLTMAKWRFRRAVK